LHEGFVSGAIDFWTYSHRCEQYGSFVIDFLAEKYELEDGMTLFISKKTKEGIPDDFLLTGNSTIQMFSYVSQPMTCQLVPPLQNSNDDQPLSQPETLYLRIVQCPTLKPQLRPETEPTIATSNQY
jgi:hypothetical protein